LNFINSTKRIYITKFLSIFVFWHNFPTISIKCDCGFLSLLSVVHLSFKQLLLFTTDKLHYVLTGIIQSLHFHYFVTIITARKHISIHKKILESIKFFFFFILRMLQRDHIYAAVRPLVYTCYCIFLSLLWVVPISC
jgi:hypothetical protein